MTTDAIWSALADPRRRAVLDLLRRRDRTVGELAELLGAAQPATSKHLKVLRDAGLVQARVDAQRRVYAIDPAPMAELDAWLAPYRRLWNERLDALGRHLDQTGPSKEE
ncbi:helix-turn-helix transcriptional regulator [Streptomyces sp. JJ36]|uniref:ArsR/SmtB family transcription factor n=1 Tax=Streptomyces sp. JJ36 TaxID=2736645 RepID=UPI001F012897|nr:metalloregulator ArsR/SmtB family transcription factor [Streptomyces sp. JJ36]